MNAITQTAAFNIWCNWEGSWYVRGVDITPPAIGTIITVTRKDGTTEQCEVKAIELTGINRDGVSLWLADVKRLKK